MTGTTRTPSTDLSTFREEGVLAMRKVLDESDVDTLKRDFWQQVGQRFAITEDDADTWFANPHNPAGDSRGRRLSGMNPVMDGLRDAKSLSVVQSALQDVVDGLFGAGRWEPLDRWFSLLSFPGDESTWSIPHTSWHNDVPTVIGDPEPWTIFVFVFLDRVERDTGPTLAVTGSHRRSETVASSLGAEDEKQVRAFDHGLSPDPGKVRLLPVGQLLPALTATDEWFAELVDGGGAATREHRFLSEGTSDGDIHSRVVDLTGEAGDVILFDPRCLHTFSANVSNRPRQILRLDFRRTA